METQPVVDLAEMAAKAQQFEDLLRRAEEFLKSRESQQGNREENRSNFQQAESGKAKEILRTTTAP